MAIRITDGSSVENLANVINEHDDSIVNHEGRIDELENATPPVAPVTSVAGKTGDVTVTKSDVGLGNVSNTADADKPISNAQAVVNAAKADLVSGKVPASQLPAYVDDVLEFANIAAFPATGENGKIYVTLDTNKTYRWSGSVYVEISASPGTTDNVPEGAINKYFTDARVASSPAVQAITPLQQAETIQYANRIIAAGSTIKISDLNAYDSFVSRGKAFGWWSKVKFFAPMLGQTLAGALVKSVVDAGGVASMINHNFIEADYNQKGIYPTVNNDKYIQTGFIPNNNGLTNSNLAVTFAVVTANDSGSGLVFSDQGTASTGYRIAAVANAAFINTGAPAMLAGAIGGLRVQTVNYNGATLISAHQNGVVQNSQTGASITAGARDTEITLFGTYTNGGFIYLKTSMSGILFTSGLTQAEALDLNRAFQDLYRSVGRINVDGGFTQFYGDSITAGAGANTPTSRWASIVNSYLRTQEVNYGIPGGAFAAVSGNTVQGNVRNTEVNQELGKTVVIMYLTNDIAIDGNATTGTPGTISAVQGIYTGVVNSFKDAGKRVISMGFPYRVGTAALKLDNYNAAAAAALRNSVNGGIYVDNLNDMRDGGNPGQYMSGDGIHPNNVGHARLAKKAIAAINGIIYRDYVFDFPSIAANSTSDPIDVLMYSASINDVVTLGQPINPVAGITYNYYVSSNDHVFVTATNNTTSAIDPPSQTMRVQVQTIY